VQLSTDPNNCGLCGKKCSSGQVCQSSQCVTTCNPSTNIATGATASSSGGGTVSTGYGPEKMKDGAGESSCTTNKFHWVTAGSTPSSQWIEYDWSSAKTVGRISIDTTQASSTACTGSGRTLAGGTIQYWSGSAWVTVGTVSNKTDDWSFTFPSPVSTTKIRIYGVHATSTTGQKSNPVIIEWQVFSC
jgi:hypothetical protein